MFFFSVTYLILFSLTRALHICVNFFSIDKSKGVWVYRCENAITEEHGKKNQVISFENSSIKVKFRTQFVWDLDIIATMSHHQWTLWNLRWHWARAHIQMFCQNPMHPMFGSLWSKGRSKISNDLNRVVATHKSEIFRTGFNRRGDFRILEAPSNSFMVRRVRLGANDLRKIRENI